MIIVADSYSESNQSVDNNLNATFFMYGQAFTAATYGVLDKCKFYLKKASSPTGTVRAELYALTGSYGTNATPTGAALATSDQYDVSTLTTSYQLITFTFAVANRVILTAGTTYVMVLSYTGASSAPNHTVVGGDNTANTHSGNYSLNDGIWAGDNSVDLCFYVYVASIGLPSNTVRNLSVGSGMSCSEKHT